MERDPSRQNERFSRFKNVFRDAITGVRRVRTDRKIHTLLEHRPDGTSSLTKGEGILNIYKSSESLSLTLYHSEEGVIKRFELDALGNRLRGYTILAARLHEFDPSKVDSNNPVQDLVYVSNGPSGQNTLPFSAVLDELDAARKFASMREPGEATPPINK